MTAANDPARDPLTGEQSQPPAGEQSTPGQTGTHQASQGYGQSPYGHEQPHYGYQYPPQDQVRRTNDKAIVSLILGIAGFIAVPLVCSILAIYFGVKAKQEIRANPYSTGDSLATGGVILGIIGTALVALGILFIVAIVVIGGFAALASGITDISSYESLTTY